MVVGSVTELEDEMMNIMGHESDKHQALEKKYSSLLHQNHYQVECYQEIQNSLYLYV